MVRCFLIRLAVKPGNVDRKPFLMAAQNVWGTGLQHDVWWYFARSLQVLMKWTLLEWASRTWGLVGSLIGLLGSMGVY